MALSFEDSKRLAAKAFEPATMDLNIEEDVQRPVYDEVDISTLADVEEDYSRSGNYTWYDEFTDNDFSTVTENKEISINANQINITQENNSQVIPFEMPRYYDGIDLMKMTIQVHYVNAKNEENYAAPVNVSYSADKIRFYWMVSD